MISWLIPILVSHTTGDQDHKAGDRLPLRIFFCTRPAVTFLAAEHHRPLTEPNYSAWEPGHICVIQTWPHLEIERSKVKVNRPLNAVTEYQPYLQNWKTYGLQTWYRDVVQWPASTPCAMTSKVKGRDHRPLAEPNYSAWERGHQAALGGCLSHHLQWAAAYCGGRTTNHTPCYYYDFVCPCGLRGCKNRPDPFLGRMSYKATKSGSVVSFF